MKHQAKILSSNLFNNELFEQESTERLLHHLRSKLDPDEEIELQKSSNNILQKCVPVNIDKDTDNTGLVIGYVQSGKTMSFTSLIALAQDNGYKIIIVISGRTRLLLGQTTERLEEDFKNNKELIQIIEANPKLNELDVSILSKRLRRGKSKKTVVITTLKHQGWLHALSKKFSEYCIQDVLSNTSVLIIDDEADQASLNTLAQYNAKNGLSEKSAIYNSIIKLRNVFPKHSYIQYTATPQGPLLIDYLDTLSPNWAVVLKPGKNYIGGKQFFSEESNNIQEIPFDGINQAYPPDLSSLEDIPDSLTNAIIEFLIISSVLCYPIKNNSIINEKSSMMIHPTVKVKGDGINKWYKWTESIIKGIINDIDDEYFIEIEKLYNKVKESLRDVIKDFPNFEDIILRLDDMLIEEENLRTWKVVGGNNNPVLGEKGEIIWSKAKHHILVGGTLLDRGFTVKDLVLTYMPRDTKGTNQADTIEQRCRFFGYKAHYLEFCKVYLPKNMIIDYKSYVDHEEDIHNRLRNQDLSDFKKVRSRMKLDSNLLATNKSRLSSSIISSNLTGYQYFEPTFPEKRNTILIEQFIKEIRKKNTIILEPSIKKHRIKSRKHYVSKINKVDILDLLNEFKIDNPTERLKKINIISYLESIIKENEKIWLIEIGPEYEKIRERTIDIKYDNPQMNFYKIASQLSFAGIWTDNTQSEMYYGDKNLIKRDTNPNINYNNELIIQIHKIKVTTTKTRENIKAAINAINDDINRLNKHKDKFEIDIENRKAQIDVLERFKKQTDDKTFYTLAFNFPDNFSNRYIELQR